METSYRGSQINTYTRYWDRGTERVAYSSVNIWRALTPRAPLIFEDDALIIFDSCRLVFTQNPYEIFQNLAKILGLTNGWIYANESFGALPPSQAFATPFYQADQGLVSKLTRLYQQAVWPITLPSLYALYYLGNKGYVTHIRDKKMVGLWKFHLSDIMNGNLPR